VTVQPLMTNKYGYPWVLGGWPPGVLPGFPSLLIAPRYPKHPPIPRLSSDGGIVPAATKPAIDTMDYSAREGQSVVAAVVVLGGSIVYQNNHRGKEGCNVTWVQCYDDDDDDDDAGAAFQIGRGDPYARNENVTGGL